MLIFKIVKYLWIKKNGWRIRFFQICYFDTFSIGPFQFVTSFRQIYQTTYICYFIQILLPNSWRSEDVGNINKSYKKEYHQRWYKLLKRCWHCWPSWHGLHCWRCWHCLHCIHCIHCLLGLIEKSKIKIKTRTLGFS